MAASKGAVASKGSAVPHDGPASMGVDLPKFSDAPPDQRFVLRYGGPGAQPAGERRFEITLTDGSMKTGKSDADGRTELLQRDAMHIAGVRILTDER